MYTPHLHMTRSLKNDWLGWVQELCPCSFLPRSWTNPVWLVTIHQSGLSSQLSSYSSYFPCPAANLAWHQLVKWLHLHLQQAFKTIHIKRNRKMFLFLNLQNFARVLVKYGITEYRRLLYCMTRKYSRTWIMYDVHITLNGSITQFIIAIDLPLP